MVQAVTYPVLSMRGSVFFPGPTVQFTLGRADNLHAIEAALAEDKRVFVVAERATAQEGAEATESSMYSMGVIARVDQVQRGVAGMQVALTGEKRAVPLDYQHNEQVLRVRAQPVQSLRPIDEKDTSFSALHAELKQQAVELGVQRGLERAGLRGIVESVPGPSELADLTASYLDLPVEEKQHLLETLSVEERMRRVLVHVQREIDVNLSRRRIRQQVDQELQGRQKEMYLREQMRAIQKELGDDAEDAELGDLESKLAALDLPKEARQEADRELARLKRAGPQSTESQVIRTYLEWFVKLPWDKLSDTQVDLGKAEHVLDEDHYGLAEVKDRILEFLSVQQLTRGSEDAKAPILLFNGPPGVGKTSVAESVAKALGRQYVRIALGGVRDEADIRGHRRTYVGAMAGRILQGIARAGTKNPVVLLDEVDKLGASVHGDPAGALLEVLDPAQNHQFTDHYLNVPFDLSQVLFIATSNVLHTIPEPLRDRMEIVEFSGYTEQEKLEIARRYLVPKTLKATGLSTANPDLCFDEEALRYLISNYTRESGVRLLSQKLNAVGRKIARNVAQGEDAPARVTRELAVQHLGRPRVHPESIAGEDRIGVATGMYYTPAGGDIMFVEAAIRPIANSAGSQSRSNDDLLGNINLVLTGQLGEVMQESARTALTCATTHCPTAGFRWHHTALEAHLHVPAGAIPKDGPSAGVTMVTALVSVLSGRTVRRDLAMTGEITLSGRVLPIGGVKEKVLGAHRAGARAILLPERNRADVEDIPQAVRSQLAFHFAETVEDVLSVALEPDSRWIESQSPLLSADAHGSDGHA